MQGVVGPLGIKTNLDVILPAASLLNNFFNLAAKVSFYFQNQAAGLFLLIARAVAQQLIGERIHSPGGLAASDGTNDHRAGKETSFRQDQPVRILDRNP